jgi:FkbM family methyltransferase
MNHSIQENSYYLAENKYGRYCVPKSSAYTYTSKAILAGKVHEPSTIKFITENNRNLDIVHAGAGFGDFLPALSKSTSGKIWTVEPNIENYLCARKTLEINNTNNVNLLNCGLGECHSKKYFLTKENGLDLGPRTRTTTMDRLENNLQECEVITLDEFVGSANVSILHLDTEGYEFEILNGAKELIKRCNPLIILEIDTNALLYNEHMRSIGYRPIKQLIYNAKEMVFVNTVYASRNSRS